MSNVRNLLSILLFLLIYGSISAQVSDPSSTSSIRRPDTLRIAWMVYRDRKDRMGDFDAMEKYLSNKLSRPVEIEIVDNYNYHYVEERMKQQLAIGKRIDIAFFTPYTYVLANQKDQSIKAFLTYEFKKDTTKYQSYFVWRQTSGNLQNVLDKLRSREMGMVFVNEYSTSGYLWPIIWLKREHHIEEFDIVKHKSEGHLKSLQILKDDPSVIAAAVWEVDYDKFLRDNKLADSFFRKEKIGPSIPIDPLAMRGGIPPAEKIRIEEILLNMHNDQEGKNILAKEAFDCIRKWIRTSDSAYDSVRRYTDINQTLNKIKIAWLTIQEDDETQEDLNKLAQYISNRIYIPVDIKIYEDKDYATVEKKMKAQLNFNDRIDIAFFNPYTYVLANRKDSKIKAFLTYKLDGGKPGCRSYFVYEASSGSLQDVLTSLKNLKKEMAYANRFSTEGCLWPISWLENKHGIKAITHESGSGYNALNLLRKKNVIIAAALGEVDYEKYMEDNSLPDSFFQKEVVLEALIPNNPLAIRGGFPLREKTKIRNVFVNMNYDPKGSEILNLNTLRCIQEWVETNDDSYAPVRIVESKSIKKSLEFHPAKNTENMRVVNFSRELNRVLSDGWFIVKNSGQEPVDISMSYYLEETGEELKMQATFTDGKTLHRSGENEAVLAEKTVIFLKETYPLEGYISKIESDLHLGMRVNLSECQGIRFFPVEIHQGSLSKRQAKSNKTIYGFVSDVDLDGFYVKTFLESDFKNPLKTDKADIYFLAKVRLPEAQPEKIKLRPKDVTISKKGDFVVKVGVEIINRKTGVEKIGLGLFLEPESSAKFYMDEGKIAESGRIFIEPGNTETDFQVFFSNAFRDKIVVSLINPKRNKTSKVIWFWVVWRLFIWASIGGLIGGLIKFLGTIQNSPSGFKQRLVKVVLDIVLGIAVGSVLWLIVLLIPELIIKLKSITPVVNGPAGRLVIGIIGGFIAVPGLSHIILKKFFK